MEDRIHHLARVTALLKGWNWLDCDLGYAVLDRLTPLRRNKLITTSSGKEKQKKKKKKKKKIGNKKKKEKIKKKEITGGKITLLITGAHPIFRPGRKTL
jgi:hypothetical protein